MKTNYTQNFAKWWQKNRTWSFIYFILVVAIMVFVAYKFLESTGRDTDIVDTEVWSHYGAFFSGILLAFTILFQVISYRRQQVENKYFELVKYYRENVQEMRFKNPFHFVKDSSEEYEEEYVTGRRAMKIVFNQYCIACKIVYDKIGKNSKYNYVLNEGRDFPYLKPIKGNQKDRFFINDIAYVITFFGIPRDRTDEVEHILKQHYQNVVIEDLLMFFKNFIANYEFSKKESDLVNNQRSYFRERFSFKVSKKDEQKKPTKDDFEDLEIAKEMRIKFFGGHQYHLGHYFRHIYHTVTYIDNLPFWLYSTRTKKEYIRSLRSQMSTYEQALFLANSLSFMGQKWHKRTKWWSNKSLIERYELIKNIPPLFIPEMIPKKFYPKIDFDIDYKVCPEEIEEPDC